MGCAIQIINAAYIFTVVTSLELSKALIRLDTYINQVVSRYFKIGEEVLQKFVMRKAISKLGIIGLLLYSAASEAILYKHNYF